MQGRKNVALLKSAGWFCLVSEGIEVALESRRLASCCGSSGQNALVSVHQCLPCCNRGGVKAKPIFTELLARSLTMRCHVWDIFIVSLVVMYCY